MLDPNKIMSYAVLMAFLAFGVIAFFVFKEFQMRKYRNDVTDKSTGEKKIRLQVIEKDRSERLTWGVKDSLVIRDLKSGDTYHITNCGFVNSWYPEGGPFVNWGLSVQKAIVIDGKPESLVRRDWEAAPVNTARIGGILRNEKVLTIASQVQDSISEKIEQFRKNELSPAVVYSLLGLVALVCIGIGFAVYVILQKFAMLGV